MLQFPRPAQETYRETSKDRRRRGNVLQIRTGAMTREITLLALSPRRVPATESAALYREGASSVARRDALAAQMKLERELHPRPRGRPCKRERRKIIQFRRGTEYSGQASGGDGATGA